eukprot:TRINITY_DN23327_c0_g1_i1.p1 TRINITY_DN23327_c0_g1~~TRINITY_DN23327_c0_g1_i1.p1  ORF type:complete len:663 (+),score=139.59 TRINITY_DN23327_c0_g1_i1:186-2174(+)
MRSTKAGASAKRKASKDGTPARISSGNSVSSTTSSKTSSSSSKSPSGSKSGGLLQKKGNSSEGGTPSSNASRAKGASLSVSQPVEDFIESGLLPEATKLLQVQSTDTVASVVERLRTERLRSCIVLLNSAGTRREFFDCSDLHVALLEALATSGDGGTGGVEPGNEAVREKLRSLGAAPIGSTLRNPRGPFAFTVFDARESLEQLIVQLKTLRRVPVFRGGKFSRIVTASDVLELCLILSEDTRAVLERSRLIEALQPQANALVDLQVPDDDTTLEVLRHLRKSDAVCAMVMHNSNESNDAESTAVPTRLASQFDIGALRSLFAGAGGAKNSSEYWWEENADSNFLLDPCMDFLAVVPSLQATSEATAPYYSINAEDSVARVVSRILASSYRSIVVQKGARSARAGQAISRGVLTTRALVIALFEAELFRGMRFDLTVGRRESGSGDFGRLAGRKVSHSRIVRAAEPVVAAPVTRRPKVTFNILVEVDRLLVPVCTEHGMHAMEYAMVDRNILDYREILDLVAEATASGAVASCAACEENIGTITIKSTSVSAPGPPQGGSPRVSGNGSPNATPTNGFFDLSFGVLSDKNRKDGAASALKNGSLKSRASGGGGKREEASSGGGMMFGFCCSPCSTSAAGKEQISAAPTRVRAGGNGTRRAST